MPDKLDKAIEEFEDEESGVPFSERFANLRKAFMWNAFEALKKVKKYGTKSPISAEEEYKQVEGMKQFRIIERIYESELKQAKIAGKTAEDIDEEYLKKIKSMKSTLSPIVRNMNEKTGTDGV